MLFKSVRLICSMHVDLFLVDLQRAHPEKGRKSKTALEHREVGRGKKCEEIEKESRKSSGRQRQKGKDNKAS
jgi:hypothetical protein